MTDETASVRIRKVLNRLDQLLEAWRAEQDDSQWIKRVNECLEELEQALGDDAPLKAQFLKETTRSYPRLTPICAAFYEDGRKLLIQATVVVRLSARSYEQTVGSTTVLRAATASLVEAVKQYRHLASEITVEAGHDIGGEG